LNEGELRVAISSASGWRGRLIADTPSFHQGDALTGKTAHKDQLPVSIEIDSIYLSLRN